MKKYLKYITLLAGVALLAAACTQNDIEEDTQKEDLGTLNLSFSIGGETRTEAYDALERSTLRIYKLVEGEEQLIRKYQPATEVPGNLYLVAGAYRAKIEAGDQSQATFTNKSYYGQADMEVKAHQPTVTEVECKITNIGVKVVYDQTILDKMDGGFKTYVSAIDTFSKTEAENGSVPTLTYTESATGYFLLPEDVQNLSWGFYSSSTVLGNISKTGVFTKPINGNLYTLTFKYSKTPEGFLGITVQVEENGEIHEDPFIFTPQPTIKGDGFDINSVAGFHTEPVSFAVSSVQSLAGITLKAANQTFLVMSGGQIDPTATTNGITYTAKDANNGTLALNGTFFSKFTGGIQEIEFLMTDIANAEGKGTARVAVAGLTDLTKYDLWLNRADFQVVVTDPAQTDIKIRYRERTTGAVDFGAWKTLTATAGKEYTYTATASDFAAGRDYEYQFLLGDTEQGTVHNISTVAGIQLPNAGFETWSQKDNTYYPCLSSEIGSNGMGTGYTGFWGSGNPGAAIGNTNISTPVNDARPGSTGTQCLQMQTKKVMGLAIAAGNIFIGTFGGTHNISKGDVYMGRPFSFNARPKAIKFWCKGTVGSGDKARLFVCMGPWNSYHKVDTGNQNTFFNPSQESLPEGPITGYVDKLWDVLPSEWTEVTLPITYRGDEHPTYLMVTATSSHRGDYMEGSTSSIMYLDDIEFVY